MSGSDGSYGYDSGSDVDYDQHRAVTAAASSSQRVGRKRKVPRGSGDIRCPLDGCNKMFRTLQSMKQHLKNKQVHVVASTVSQYRHQYAPLDASIAVGDESASVYDVSESDDGGEDVFNAHE